MRDFVSFDTGFDDEAIILAAMHLLPIGHPAVLKDFGGWATSPQIAWEVRFALGASIDEPWEISNLESYLQKRGGNDTHRAYSFNEKLERAIQSSNWIVKVDKRYHLKAIWRLIRKIESEYAHFESRSGPLTPEEELLYIRSRKKIALLHWSIKFGLPANISPVGIWLPGNIQEMTQAFTPGFLDAFYYNDAVDEGKFQGELNLINAQSTTYASERYTAGLLAGGHELNAAIYSLIPSGGGSGHMAGGARAKASPKATTRTVDRSRTVGTAEREAYVPPNRIPPPHRSKGEMVSEIVERLGKNIKSHPLRQAYEKEVSELRRFSDRIRPNMPLYELRSLANEAHSSRRELGIKYKDLTPRPLRDYIYDININRYGDELGPSMEFLINNSKLRGNLNNERILYENIIRSSSRPNSDAEKLLNKFGEWLIRKDSNFIEEFTNK